MTALPRNTILPGDALQRLRELPPSSVDCILTSPPYFAVRDYGVAGQLGSEPSVAEWVANLRAVAAEAARVLVPTGTLWLNLGDSFSRHGRYGAPPKGLLLAPERLLLALAGDGWLVRNKLIYAKTNPLPTSVRDRLNLTYEVVYLLVRSRRYFFDLDAIRVPHRSRPTGRRPPGRARETSWTGPLAASRGYLDRYKQTGQVGHPLGKNPGDVWRITPDRGRGPHHATFPLALADRVIRAGCPERRCRTCRLPWRRPIVRLAGGTARRGALSPECACGPASEPGLVLDPFMGSGTTAVAAESLGRDWLGIELNPVYVALAEARIAAARVAGQQAASAA